MGLFTTQPREETTGQRVQEVGGILRRYLKLLIEDARLTAAEKLTILFSTVSLFALVVIVGVVALVFVSIGIGHLLAETIAPVMAYLYIAGFYILVLIAMIVFKRQLFIDPICRFVTRLIVEPPKPQTERRKTEIDEKR